MIVLHHGGPAGHSASVLIALAEKGLDFDSRPLDLADFEQHGADFLAINPAGQVPVLDIDGHRLTETFFILLYLDERFPDPPLGGADPQARYRVQKWGKYVETHLAPNLALVGWSMRGPTPNPEVRARFDALTPERRLLWRAACDGFGDADIEKARAAVTKTVDRIAEDLEGGRWLADSYSIADIAAYPHVVRARDLGFDMPARVVEWLDRIATRLPLQKLFAADGAEFATMGPERGRWG